MYIKTIREQKYLNQEELAKLSELSVRTIKRLEASLEPRGGLTVKVLSKTHGIDFPTFGKQKTSKETLSHIKKHLGPKYTSLYQDFDTEIERHVKLMHGLQK